MFGLGYGETASGGFQLQVVNCPSQASSNVTITRLLLSLIFGVYFKNHCVWVLFVRHYLIHCTTGFSKNELCFCSTLRACCWRRLCAAWRLVRNNLQRFAHSLSYASSIDLSF